MKHFIDKLSEQPTQYLNGVPVPNSEQEALIWGVFIAPVVILAGFIIIKRIFKK